MRYVYLLLLLLFFSAIIIFTVQNKDRVTIEFLGLNGNFPIAAVMGAVYVLGMFTGWSVVGFLRRTFKRATEARPPQ